MTNPADTPPAPTAPDAVSSTPPECPRCRQGVRMVYADGTQPHHDLKHPHWRCEFWIGSGVCGTTLPIGPAPAAPDATPALTAAQLDTIERLEREASPGPWDTDAEFDVLFGPNDDGTGIAFDHPPDAKLIALLRNAAPALFAAARAAADCEAKLRVAQEWVYGDQIPADAQASLAQRLDEARAALAPPPSPTATSTTPPECPHCGRRARFYYDDPGDDVTPPMPGGWHCDHCGVAVVPPEGAASRPSVRNGLSAAGEGMGGGGQPSGTAGTEICQCSVCGGNGFVGSDGETCPCIKFGCRKRHHRDAVLAADAPAASPRRQRSLEAAAQSVIDAADTTGEMNAPFVVPAPLINALAAALPRATGESTPPQESARDAILYAFHVECERPTAQQIIEWTRRFPQFAEDIRAHAAVARDWVAADAVPSAGAADAGTTAAPPPAAAAWVPVGERLPDNNADVQLLCDHGVPGLRHPLFRDIGKRDGNGWHSCVYGCTRKGVVAWAPLLPVPELPAAAAAAVAPPAPPAQNERKLPK